MADATPTVKIVDNHEVHMAQAQVYKAAKCAIELHKMLKYVDNLEGWMQAKITLAAEYLDAVSSNLEYDIVSQTMQEPMTTMMPGAGPVADVEVDMEPEMMMQEEVMDPKAVGMVAGQTIIKNNQVQNPYKPGTPEYSKFEQGKREAANKAAQPGQPGQTNEAELFPQLRQDMRTIGRTIGDAVKQAWHGTPEEQAEQQRYMRDAWIRYFRRQKQAAGEVVDAEAMRIMRALADEMVAYKVKAPLMSRLKEGQSKTK